MLKNEMESYERIGGRGLKNLTYPYMGEEGVKICQNHLHVINEWPLSTKGDITIILYILIFEFLEKKVKKTQHK